jgi:hypothetical protein
LAGTGGQSHEQAVAVHDRHGGGNVLQAAAQHVEILLRPRQVGHRAVELYGAVKFAANLAGQVPQQCLGLGRNDCGDIQDLAGTALLRPPLGCSGGAGDRPQALERRCDICVHADDHRGNHIAACGSFPLGANVDRAASPHRVIRQRIAVFQVVPETATDNGQQYVIHSGALNRRSHALDGGQVEAAAVPGGSGVDRRVEQRLWHWGGFSRLRNDVVVVVCFG